MFDIFYGACVLLYGGSSFYLAFIGKPAELAGFVVAGAISLVFLKLDSFKEFGGAGFSAKLADKVSRLEKEIDPIRNKQTEPESSRKPATGVTRSSDEKAYEDVLFALTNGRYSWRTRSEERRVGKEC